jgi:creatinine amidohydrolase
LTWQEVAERALVAVLPVGSCEQHGPHLPLDTDTRIAEAVSRAVVAGDPRLVLAPTLGITASGEHQDVPGTLSIGAALMEEAVVEIARSADAFAGLLVVNGHGGNLTALEAARERIVAEGRHLAVLSCHVPGGEPHAGWGETSILMHLCPDLVRVDRMEPGVTEAWSEIGPVAVQHGFAAVTPNGVLGDPTRATADDGARLLSELVDRIRHAAAEVTGGWLT